MASVAVFLTACGTGDGGATTTVSSTTTTTEPVVTTTTSSQTTTTVGPSTTTTTTPPEAGVVAYFLLEELEPEADGPFLVPVHREGTTSDDLGEQAIQHLLQGPTAEESSGIPSISTSIPDGTIARGVASQDGVVTVDLSGDFDDGGGSFSMFARLAQTVFTLTAVPGVEAVLFQIEGEPVTVFSGEGIELDGPQSREDYYEFLPPIFVDSPAWGAPVTSPISVRGLSNVFEAVSQVMLTDDDGLPLHEATVTATCGTGCWGEWAVEIPYAVDREQVGALIVWEYSAKDGSRVNVREYPIRLR